MKKKIIIGCVQFGLKYGIANKNKIKNLELKKIFNFCKKNNILKFDTSLGYGNIDKKILEFFKKDKIKIYTKISKLNYNKFLRVYSNNTDKIECIYFHDIKDFNDIKFRKKVLHFKKKFKIKSLGLSIYEEKEIKYINKDINVLQIPINILNRNFEKLNKTKKLQNKEIEINARSIFQQGIFALNNNKIKKNLKELDKPIIKIKEFSTKNNLTAIELSLIYVNSLSFINHLIIGINSLNQLKKNIFSLKKKVPKNLNKFLNLNNFNNLQKVNINKW